MPGGLRACPGIGEASLGVEAPGWPGQARAARYRSGRDTVQLLAGPGYLYVAANSVGIPTNVMFFPQDPVHFTAFDPSTSTRTTLWFGQSNDGLVTMELADRRRVSGVREGVSPR